MQMNWWYIYIWAYTKITYSLRVCNPLCGHANASDNPSDSKHLWRCACVKLVKWKIVVEKVKIIWRLQREELLYLSSAVAYKSAHATGNKRLWEAYVLSKRQFAAYWCKNFWIVCKIQLLSRVCCEHMLMQMHLCTSDQQSFWGRGCAMHTTHLLFLWDFVDISLSPGL